MPPKMTERVDVLEARMNSLENSLTQSMEEFCRSLMTEFAKLQDCCVNDETRSPSFSTESVLEYKMPAKKVELPPFDKEDLVGWITHAEPYFEVHGSSEEMKVRLAKLSMEGSAIHWFNLLCETEDALTWSKQKKSLIERYGGRVIIH